MSVSAEMRKIYAAIMNIHIDFTDQSLRSGEKKIEALSDMLALAGPVIGDHHGLLTRVSEEGITAVFENNTEDTLHAAFSLFRSAEEMLGSSSVSRLTIGIHYGMVYLTKVGYGEFITPLAISEGVYVARRLCEEASRYDAHILITNTAAQRIRSFRSRFSSRKLGLFCSVQKNREEMIYDLFDSDPTELKYRKRRSHLVLETGVNLFLEEKYAQARVYFIELLKFDRSDKVAKKYVYLCDRFLSGEADPATEKYLEIWLESH